MSATKSRLWQVGTDDAKFNDYCIHIVFFYKTDLQIGLVQIIMIAIRKSPWAAAYGGTVPVE